MRRLLPVAIALLALLAGGCEIGGFEFDPGSDPGRPPAERLLGDPAAPPPGLDSDVEGRVSSVGAVSGDIVAGFTVDGRTTVFVLRGATIAMDSDGVLRALSPGSVREGDAVQAWGEVRHKGRRSSIEATYVLIGRGE